MVRVRRFIAAAVGAIALLSAAPAAALPVMDGADMKKATTGRHSARPAGFPKLVPIARSQIGAPYSYGGTTPAGFDCSGFTSWVYSHIGVTLPHSSGAQYSLGGSGDFESIASIEDLEVGDLVFHGSGSDIQHVGIYVGDNQFVSATSSSGIQVRSLFDSYWGPLWVGGVRYSR